MTQARVPLILGTMTFAKEGTEVARISDHPSVQKVIDIFKSYGHTELDTARLYGEGTTEELLSNVDLSNTSIDSKCYPSKPGDHSPQALRNSLTKSLQALKVPKLRVFYLHAPDRATPFKETLHECDQLYKEGKFEALGLSNFAAWEVAVVCGICEKEGFIKPTIYQGMYNAITRAAELELFPCCRALGLRVVVYNPIAGGFFSGKVKTPQDSVERGSRFDSSSKFGKLYQERYFRPLYFEALSQLEDKLKNHPDISLPSVGLRWLQHHSQLGPKDGIIIGVSSIKQTELNCADSAKGPLPQDIVDAVDEAWRLVKADCPPYWR